MSVNSTSWPLEEKTRKQRVYLSLSSLCHGKVRKDPTTWLASQQYEYKTGETPLTSVESHPEKLGWCQRTECTWRYRSHHVTTNIVCDTTPCTTTPSDVGETINSACVPSGGAGRRGNSFVWLCHYLSLYIYTCTLPLRGEVPTIHHLHTMMHV
jgi:hypothetical protein